MEHGGIGNQMLGRRVILGCLEHRRREEIRSDFTQTELLSVGFIFNLFSVCIDEGSRRVASQPKRS